MLLAIADARGLVVGTDVAIARRINVPLDTFTKAMAALMSPDQDSNSKECEGRRIVASEGERGYRLVNYVAYRDLRDEDQRREYMAGYMAQYRSTGRDKSRPVNSGKLGKHGKLLLANADADADADGDIALLGEKRLAEPGMEEDAMRLCNLMEDCLDVLGTDEMGVPHRHKSWLARAEKEPDKLRRVLAEIERKKKEGEPFTKSAGACAEDLWKRFQ
jgi:hypothetical protein